METFITQLETLDIPEDDACRTRLKNAISSLQVRLEDPIETLVKYFSQHLELSLIRVGIEVGLFKYLAENGTLTLTIEFLAEKLGVSPNLLGRIVRFLSSIGIVDEIDTDMFRSNKTTNILASPTTEAVIIHSFDIIGPTVQALPAFLSERNYRDISTSNITPFQRAFDTDLTCFEWLTQHPGLLGSVQTVMTAFQSADWMKNFRILDDIFEAHMKFEHDRSENEVRRPFFVDVGGGYGHQCINLRDKYPELSLIRGSIILQDLSGTVNSLKIEGVRVMPHDFFLEQPVIGSRIYYLRRILHDWSDEFCITILSRLVTAMASDSTVLIDEIILPKKKAPHFATMADINMMITFGGKERCEGELDDLARRVGLEVKSIWRYSERTGMAIVVLGKT